MCIPAPRRSRSRSRWTVRARGAGWRAEGHRTNGLGETGRLVLPIRRTRRLYRVGVCVRRRLPLQLAWAITVHKSQGMSLPRLQVELANAFAEGQVAAEHRVARLERRLSKLLDPHRGKGTFHG